LRKQLETNLLGWPELTNLVLPVIRTQGSGKIIMNSSVLGIISMQYRGAYNISKYAVEGLADTLRQELYGTGIYISLIEPGPIKSSFRKNAYSAYLKNINTQNSYHQQNYRALEKWLNNIFFTSKEPPFTLHPEAVLKCLLHAIESKWPKARYDVTIPTYILGYLKSLLSTKSLDIYSTKHQRLKTNRG
jgi:short-subunit dehydrogenase